VYSWEIHQTFDAIQAESNKVGHIYLRYRKLLDDKHLENEVDYQDMRPIISGLEMQNNRSYK
jgi:hypothetical protein